MINNHVLVTGGAGFIGHHLCNSLLNDGKKVTVLDNLSSGKIENIHSSVIFYQGDINDEALVEKLMRDVEICYHLAAIPSVTKSVEDWKGCHKVNLTGTINIFETAAKFDVPVVYASSAAVYGDNSIMPLSEESAKNIISPYGADKFSCELQAAAFGKTLNLKSLGLRFFNVYGSNQDPNSEYSGVISKFINQIKNNEPITIFGDGSQIRDFVHVSDIVNFLKAASVNVSIDAKVFNCCTGISNSILSLAETLLEITESKSNIVFKNKRIGDIHISIGCPQEASLVLGVTAAINLKQGLKKTIG